MKSHVIIIHSELKNSQLTLIEKLNTINDLAKQSSFVIGSITAQQIYTECLRSQNMSQTLTISYLLVHSML